MFFSLLFLGIAEELSTDQLDSAMVTDVTVTSSVLTLNECQSLFDRTNAVKTNDICSLCKVSNNRKSSVLVVVYSSISPAFV